MADVLEDPKKKKASFGDSAAAATDPNVTQVGATPPAAPSQIPNSAPPGWSGGAGNPVEGSDASRNINNSLNALGGMGAVASVPLKGASVVGGAMRAPPVLESAVQRIGMAKPAADWVAGMGPGAQVSQAANTIPQAVGAAPRVIAGLQEGAQANSIAAGARALGGASAMATGADAQQVRPVSAGQAASQSKPMGAEDGMMPGTRAVMSGFADDAKTMMAKGQYGALAGQLGRATAAMPLAVAEDVLRPALGLAQPIFQGAANAVKTFVTGDSSPAQFGALNLTGAVQPGAAQAVAKPSALTDGRANAFADPRSLLNPSRQEPPVTGAPVAAPIAAAGVAPPPSLEGAAIAPTQTEGQRVMDMNNKLADSMKADRLAAEQEALGVPQNTVVHSGNDWAARKALANLETGASSIMNKTGGRGGVSPAVTAYVNAFNADRALQGGGTAADINNTNVAQQNAAMKATQGTEALRMKQSSAQFGANQEIAKQRLALDGRKADIADTGAQMDNATKKQLQGLNAQILNETDPAKLSVLQDKAQTITGKYQRPDAATRMTVVPQGSYIDEKTQQVVHKPSIVVGPDGQVVGQQQAQQSSPGGVASPKSKAEYDSLPKGAQYMKDGVLKTKA